MFDLHKNISWIPFTVYRFYKVYILDTHIATLSS